MLNLVFDQRKKKCHGDEIRTVKGVNEKQRAVTRSCKLCVKAIGVSDSRVSCIEVI